MDLDNELTRMLEESVGHLNPPVAEMVTEGNRLGRRRKLRRQLQMAGAALTVTAVAATGTVIALNQANGRTTQVTAAVGPSLTVSPSPTPTPTPSSPFSEPATAQLTPEAMLKLVADQLPAGAKLDHFEKQPYGKTDPTQEVAADFQYNDGHGNATIQLGMRKVLTTTKAGATALSHVISCAQLPLGNEGTPVPGSDTSKCQDIVLPDGSKEVLYTTYADVASLYAYEVVINRPNGDVVQLYVYNGTIGTYNEQGKLTVTRARPPIDMASWRKIAEDPKWQFLVPQSMVDAGAEFAKNIRHVS